MLFELSVALKYLLPRRRQLSRSIISLISIGVISLVVWLILVFFSVTTGLEKIWVDKMIALTAPVRIIPTEKYYSSYYHQIDTLAEESAFSTKSLLERWENGAPSAYNIETDPELPPNFPKPDLDETGIPKDLIARLRKSANALPDVKTDPYAMAPAQLRLTLLRESGPLLLTQAVYVGTFDGKDPLWNRAFANEQKTPFSPTWDEKKSRFILPTISSVGEGVLVPRLFRDSGVKVGDRGSLSYFAPGVSRMHELHKEIFVAGFYDPGILPIGGRFILASSELTESLRSAPASSDRGLSEGINLKFNDRSKATAVKEKLLSLFDQNGIPEYFDVLTFEEFDFTKDLIQQLKSEKNIFSLLALIIILVACSNIISMLIILVNDKKKEIAIMRAMGASSGSISLIFGFTGAVTGMIGSFIGFLLALATLHHFDTIIALLTRLQGFQAFNPLFFGNELPNTLSGEALVFVLSTTILLSIISGLIPAFKASRLNPSEVLRAE